MRKQIEGSQAIAQAVAACRPQVISAYPISPQTHIVEALSSLVKRGEIPGCEYMNMESEFGAMSGCIGASAVGARTYTATASQGLLFMSEAVFNASGLGLPIVMTVANRAIGAPINIWNDHTDAMSQRDSGWLQLYAEDNQEAADLHVQAYKIAEELSLPVMVCMDGFILTHAVEVVDVPEEEQVNEFLPSYEPRQVLDPKHPVSIGAMVGPEAYTEVRYLAHHKQMRALELIPKVQKEFQEVFGRDSGGLVRGYRLEDAETVVVAMGSMLGTIKDVVDQRREAGEKVGVLGIISFRPFPTQAVREAISHVKRFVMVEKAFSVGIGGIVSSMVRSSVSGMGIKNYELIAGLGGRPITKTSLHEYFDKAFADQADQLTFLDLDRELVEHELAREDLMRRSGPTAENVVAHAHAKNAAAASGTSPAAPAPSIVETKN